jgi:hypothetical protein
MSLMTKLLPRQDRKELLLTQLSAQQQVMTKLLADLKSWNAKK